MVTRQLDSHGATIVDLDGTYLRSNSLHVLLRLGLRRLPMREKMQVAWLLIRRRLRLISHEAMKHPAVAKISRHPEIMAEFADKVKAHISPSVAAFLAERAAAGDRILLATAASETYVPLLWHGEYIASPVGGPDLRGKAKADAVSAWLTVNGLRPTHFLTDHSDDIPAATALSCRGAEIHIVNPSQKTLKAFSNSDMGFKIDLAIQD